MENNVFFREDLIVGYLSELVSMGNKEEFDKFYPSVEGYLQELLNKSTDLETLKKIGDIVAFELKSVGSQSVGMNI